MRSAVALAASASFGIVAACAGGPAAAPPPHRSEAASPASATAWPAPGESISSASSSSSSSPVAPPSAPPSPSAIFGRIESDLAACYERGRKEVPTMTSGKITLLASIDATGTTSCVVPSDDTGLTLDVETCMRERMQRETYTGVDQAWTTAIPVVVHDAKLRLGEPPKQPPSIETIESQGLAEDVYDVVGDLLPELYACVRQIGASRDLRVISVGAKVGADGRVECALATSSSFVPPEIRACAVRVVSRAKFRPPKKGQGLLSVPLILVGRG